MVLNIAGVHSSLCKHKDVCVCGGGASAQFSNSRLFIESVPHQLKCASLIYTFVSGG